jgi:hypothetical protein
MTKQTDLWPFCEGSGLISRDLARSIRAWALTEMTEAELNSYSQRQLMQMYIHRGIVPTIEKVLKRERTLEESSTAAKVVLDKMPPATDPDFVEKTVALFRGDYEAA